MLTIDQFEEIDNLAIQNFALPIELMMENAGLHLAHLVSSRANRTDHINIGVGPGNNGGGGLVASRRLAAWGYQVHLLIPDRILKPLPSLQLGRAQAAGADLSPSPSPKIYVDAFFGFSQRLPLPHIFLSAIQKANSSTAFKISLDLPSGFNKLTGESSFNPDLILTMAAPKTELLKFGFGPNLLIADIGIPKDLYELFGIQQPDFSQSGIIRYADL